MKEKLIIGKRISCYDTDMKMAQDRILIVESDPLISDLISRQALQAAGFQTFVVADGSAAISRAMQLAPDLIITNLQTPGLSGKDLLVVLNSQRMDIPVIVVAAPGMESEVIQTFRLGAADYLILPLREAEIVQAVERILKQVHERRERDRLEKQLQKTNQELQQRVRELTAIFSIGKAVTSVTDQAYLFEKILEGAVGVTQADMGWLMLWDESSNAYLLAAQRNLPQAVTVRMNQPWDDGISSLVAMSGEPLCIHGDPVKRFKISALGQSVLIVPVKVQKQVVGLLVTVRRQSVAFTPSEQHLLEAVADYASISLVNARLFRAVEQRARAQQIAADNARLNEEITQTLLESVRRELDGPLSAASRALDGLNREATLSLNPNRRRHMNDLLTAINTLAQVEAGIEQALSGMRQGSQGATDLVEMIQEAARRFSAVAEKNQVRIAVHFPEGKVLVPGTPGQLAQALDGFLSHALRSSIPSGQVEVQLEVTGGHQAHGAVSDGGHGLEPAETVALFDPKAQAALPVAQRYGGLGINLPVVKQIITSLGGKVWVESQKGEGTIFHFTLPIKSRI